MQRAEPVNSNTKRRTDSLLSGHTQHNDALRGLLVPESESDAGHESQIERGHYSVRLANTAGQRSNASMLIQRRYSWRGYHTDVAETLPHDPNRITLEASSGPHLAGTLTLGLDSQEGLLSDVLYGQEIDLFRDAGAKVCELSQLAIDPQYSSKEILASLFHLAYIYGRIVHRVTDVFIEVNPRHAGYYKRMLGFRQIGETCICARVNAPAVLLHVEVEYIDRQIAEHGGGKSGGSATRSLYPYFFSKVEEEGLTLRILKTNQQASDISQG